MGHDPKTHRGEDLVFYSFFYERLNWPLDGYSLTVSSVRGACRRAKRGAEATARIVQPAVAISTWKRGVEKGGTRKRERVKRGGVQIRVEPLACP